MARTIKSCKVKYLILFEWHCGQTSQLSFTNKKHADKAWIDLINRNDIMRTRFVVLP